VEEDIERHSFNTSVSSFMICVNELSALKCHHRAVLEPFLVILSPYAPHIAEELWERLGHDRSILEQRFPVAEDKYLVEASHEYPVSINGKMRVKLSLPSDLSREEIEKAALAHEDLQNWIEGKTPKKVIVVPGKIVNIVI
jgi:leucyl-tRNA synthetase